MRNLLSYIILFCCLTSFAQVDSRLLSPLPDLARDDCIGFAIEGLGYIQGGRMEGFAISDQLWTYHPELDNWEQRAPLPGIPRQYASSFVLGGKAYLLGGAADPGLRLDELWCYDPSSNLWTQLNDFPGGERYAMTTFVYQGVAYAGLGKGYSEYYDDLWRYNLIADEWQPVLQFPMAFFGAVHFTLNDLIYIGTGLDTEEQPIATIWSFDGESLQQAQDYSYPLSSSDALNIGGQAIIIGGSPDTDQAIDGMGIARSYLSSNGEISLGWEDQLGLAGGEVRNGAVFAIGDKGYYFGGKDGEDVRSNQLIELSVSTHDNSIRVWPNPTCVELLIESQEAFDQINVFNSNGQRVIAQELSDPTTSIYLSLDGLALGTYLIQAGAQGVKKVLRVCGR